MFQSESLKKNKDFQNVYQKGTSKANRYLVMYVLENQYNRNRLGISVSKKNGNSVVRHRITRLLRESYRLNEKRVKYGLDIVVIARPSVKGKSYFDVERSLIDLFKKHGVLQQNDDEEAAE